MADTLLATIERRPDLQVRVAKNSFKGFDYYHIREWYLDRGEWRAGKGIALRANELAQVASALDTAAGIAPTDDPTESWGK